MHFHDMGAGYDFDHDGVPDGVDIDADHHIGGLDVMADGMMDAVDVVTESVAADVYAPDDVGPVDDLGSTVVLDDSFGIEADDHGWQTDGSLGQTAGIDESDDFETFDDTFGTGLDAETSVSPVGGDADAEVASAADVPSGLFQTDADRGPFPA